MRTFEGIISRTALAPAQNGSETMSGKKYWVVGGEYANTNFDSLKEGSGTLVGPFYLREDAVREWKRLSETSGRALIRFTIAEEPMIS